MAVCLGARLRAPATAALVAPAAGAAVLPRVAGGGALPSVAGRERPRAAMQARRGASTRGFFYYQGAQVPTSWRSTGSVGTYRDGLGSDGEFFGVDPVPVEMQVHDGRGDGFRLDESGFELVPHRWGHVDYYNNAEVLNAYYPEVEALVCRHLGAKACVAFDHNIRARGKKAGGAKLSEGGNAVQEPLIQYGVHNDYTVTSAAARLRQMAEPPRHNDTLRPRLGATPAVDPAQVEELLAGRWVFMNIWRNISIAPVQRFPLGFIDARTTSTEELVVFEIRYADRVGENYFTRHSANHRWVYFPQLTRDEVVMLKVWDSRGRDFVDEMPSGAADKSATVPSTFALHSAFEDPATPDHAPDRESIEVRTVAFF